MQIYSKPVEMETQGYTDVVNVTGEVEKALTESGIENGTVTVFAVGSTAGVTTIEYEPGLKKDMADYLENIAPYKGAYAHHETWHDDNGAAHVRATLLGPSLTVPVVNGKMTLGTWQQIVVICMDTRPRTRRIMCQCMGE